MTAVTTPTPVAPPLPEEQRNATVAVYGDLKHAEDAVRALEHADFDMSRLSIVASGLTSERHVIGFESHAQRAERWARWGGLWGVLFGALLFIPGIGQVAVGGYVLYLLMTGAVGAGAGFLTAALSSVGVPDDAIIRYESALRIDKQLLIVHGTQAEIERAHELLSATNAESVEAHLGEPQPVA